MFGYQADLDLQVAPINYTGYIGFGSGEDVGGHYSSVTVDIKLNPNVANDLTSQQATDVEQAVTDFANALKDILTIEGDTVNLQKRILTLETTQLI